jgi:NADH-quinone oxidoreductase subunit G
LSQPLVRNAEGELVPASWPEALAAAAAGLVGKRAGVVVGGRPTLEDAYGYAKFARIALNTNDIDFRARLTSDEEANFLASTVVGSAVEYKDIDSADHLLLVAFEPEEESPIVFLRINKNFKKRALTVTSVASKASIAMDKLKANFIKVAPGNEAQALASVELTAKSVILVGERASESAGLLSAAHALAHKSGAKLAWIPRRAGERGALEAGAFAHLLPGGRPVADSAARVDMAAAWGVSTLPSHPGRSVSEMIDAVHNGDLDALVVGGVDIADMPHGLRTTDAFKKAFVVSLEIAHSSVTEVADVVLPVAAITEKYGTFINWEGRPRTFAAAVADSLNRSDVRILSVLADAMGQSIMLGTVTAAAREFAQLGKWEGARVSHLNVPQGSPVKVSGDQAIITSWRRLLDEGSLQVGEDNLAGTRRPTIAVISPARAATLAVSSGDNLRISNQNGSITLPALVEDIHDDAVWLPRNSIGSNPLQTLNAVHGELVTVVKA